MKKKLLENRIFVIFLLFFMLIYLFYIKSVSYNIPFMDYWRTILRTIELMEQDISVFDIIWKSDFGQRNPLTILCLILNIKYFSLNCIISEYMAVIPITISCILLYKRWIKSFCQINSYINYKAGLCIFVMLSLFNFNQWEILHIQFAFPFMARICIYIFTFYLVDQAISDNNVIQNKKIVLSGIIAIIAICGLSQLYFVAFVLCVWITLILNYWVAKRMGKNISLKHIFIWIALSILGMLLYFYNIDMSSSGSANINNYVEILLNGDLIKGVLNMLAAIILPQSLLEQLYPITTYTIGSLVLLLVFFSLFLFFYYRLYETSYMPILLILYGCINIGVISLGRIGLYGSFYMISSRYVVETTLIICGVTYILSMVLIMKPERKWESLLLTSSIICIICCLCISFFTEINNAKYRQAYKAAYDDVLRNIEDATDEDLIGLQAEPDYIRSLTYILKEKKLGLFSKDISVSK